MKKIKLLISNFLYSLKITYTASHKYFVLKFVLAILLSFFPFINIYIWKNIINFLTNKNDYENIYFLLINIIVYMLFYLITQLLLKASEYINYKYNDKVNIFIENVMIDKFAEVDLSFYDSSKLNDKLSHTNNILYSMIGLTESAFYTLQTIITFITSLILLSTLNIWYVVLILILSIPVFINKLKANKLNVEFYKNNSNTSRRMNYFKGLFRNVNNSFDIRLFDLKNFFIGKYINAWTDWYNKRKTVTLKSTVLTLINLLLSSFVNQILLYAIIINKLSKRIIQIGDATYYISVFNQFYNSTEGLISNVVYLQYAFDNLMTVKEFLELSPTVQKSGTVEPTYFNDITFSHVYFKYPGKDNYILEDCTFSIKKGQTVGLVGENGSGKSTIVKLLLRFYDVSDGQILIDGIDIKEYDIVKYRVKFSVLFQDFIQYRLTLRENIALSNYDNLDDDQKINDAIKSSELYDIVKDWGKGLETSLTRHYDSDGKELSGGQWQRVALARVFFSNRDFIILDEPSASLDVFAEEKIFKQFEQLSDNRSSLIISHRLSSIVNSDIIIVLKDGKIIEQGSHRKLMNVHGYYAELFNLQASRYIAEVKN